MSRMEPVGIGRLAAVLGLVVAVLGGLALAKGAFLVGKHEGDTLHLVDMVLRMGLAGQVPHLDFMTPIGIGATWPIAAFVAAGFGVGHAFFAAQIAVALVLLLPTLLVARSRFPGWVGLAFGAYVMGLCLALVHGEANAVISPSMHYNRWAWALAYLALPLAILRPLPGATGRPALEGAVIGLALAGLALTKVTYFVALAPAIFLALALRRDWARLGLALGVGLLVAAAMTAGFGFDYWLAYVHDLLAVSRSTIRGAPGADYAEIITAPPYLLGSLGALALVIYWRQSGFKTEGLALLVALPGLAYITYQNWGNDPQWLILLAAFAITLRPDPGARSPEGWPLAAGLGAVALVLATAGAPSAINLFWSPLRHFNTPTDRLVPMIGKRAADADLLVSGARAYHVTEIRPADGPGQPYAAYAALLKAQDIRPEAQETEAVAELNGAALPDCEVGQGYGAVFDTWAKDLGAAGFGGAQIFVADLFSSLWLYGDFPPLAGGTPWYYGGTPGLAGAEHVLVPLCPLSAAARAAALEAVAQAGWRLEEEARGASWVLLRPVR